MRLRDLLEGLKYSCVQGNVDTEITSVVYDSRKLTQGCLFICIVGTKFDGHDFAADAVSQNAAALVVSREVHVGKAESPDVGNAAGGAADEASAKRESAAGGAAVIQVEDTRYAMAFISAAWFGHPAEKLKVIGITGTKGKTTTSYVVKSVLEQVGLKVGLVGTIEAIIGETHIHAENTTPESYTLQEDFARMVEAGMDAVVMEVSSQALKLHRTQGFVFDYGIFTNLEPDHIAPGEHENFEEYMACKGRLFRQCRIGIVNGDDAHVAQVTQGHSCRLETFGMGEECMLRAQDLQLVHDHGRLGVDFHVAGLMDFQVHTPFPGRFSVYNALCAIAICRHFQVGPQEIRKGLESARVKGRIERVEISPKFTLLIDYAHNAMALESLLSSLREYEPGRLVCLFGCGGNRDRNRRFEMGEVSGRLADFTVITSDNPRFEEPQSIIGDIRTGIEKTSGRYVEICDRREAIAYVISHAQEGDLIVLAGKGHEDYQEIKGKKYPMDERVIIQELLEGGLKHI